MIAWCRDSLCYELEIRTQFGYCEQLDFSILLRTPHTCDVGRFSDMATSPFKTTQYKSLDLTESAGVVLFDAKTNRICLLRHEKSEWLLPKGRRNLSESRAEAAVREAQEETGFRCRLLPVTMFSRQPLSTDLAASPDESTIRSGIVEPFMFTVREVEAGRVKVIWWFVAVVSKREDEGDGSGGEEQFEVGWFGLKEAVDTATFETDREVLREGIKLFE